MEVRTAYRSLESGRVNRQHTALRLFSKAKRLGIWNPADLDLTQDAHDWKQLPDDQKDLLAHLASLFVAGEEAVTLDLLPLMRAVAEDGHFEDEIYLTSFLWEEAKHVDFFWRFLDEVADLRGDLHHYPGASYGQLFGVELPNAMNRLNTDRSPVAQAEASVVYNLIVEGMLAETGYHAWYTILKRNGLMPGTVAGIELVQRDEARHIRYGVFLLSRLIAAHGDPVWDVIQERMMALMPVAVNVLLEAFATLEERHGHIPFGLEPDEFADFAMRQFRKRMQRIERARGQSLETVLYGDPVADEAV